MRAAVKNVTTIKTPSNSEGLSIIIPAAGVGHRMKSYGPKAMIEVSKNTTLIEKQIKTLWKEYPSAEIFVVVGFDAERIIEKLSKYPVRIIYNHLYDSTSVLYSIGLAMNAVTSKEVLVVYGDLVFNQHTVNKLRGKSKIVAENSGFLKKSEVGIASHNDKVTNFSFGLDTKWCQIVYLSGKELDIFQYISFKKETKQWLGYEALNYIIKQGGQISVVFPKKMSIVEIDSIKDLDKIK
jgi:choline kinase